MEAFSLLKYWRGAGGGGGGSDGGANMRCSVTAAAAAATTTTIVTAVSHHAAETDDDDDDDDGPFFDLEFAVQDEEEEEEEDGGEKNDGTKDGQENENDEVESEHDGGAAVREEEEDEEDEGEEREFNFTISSNSSGNDRTDQNLTLSPSDDLFFKGRLVPIESSSLVFNSAEPNSKPQFPVSLLKSATKFRVFMLGFKKSKQNAAEKPEATSAAAGGDGATSKQQQKPEAEKEKEKEKQSKFFTVKFKVEEVPIVSLFTRDNNGSRKSQSQSQSQLQSQKHQNNNVVEDSVSVSVTDEKRFSKDVMQKYLKKVKPLYVRVSKRYGEKLKFSGQLSLGSATKSVQSPPPPPPPPPSTAKVKPPVEKTQTEAASAEPGETQVKSQKQANIPERLRVVCKHLGKSRSASSAVAAAPVAPVAQRRDDSLLQQQDNIQSAILHCKRSFNASRDSSDSSVLPRSISDPSNHKSTMELSRKSSDEVKD